MIWGGIVGKILKILNGILTTVITVCLSSMVILVFLNVVLRYGLNSGITWSEEMARYLFVWIVFLGTVVAYKDNAHLGVDLFIGVLSPKLQKGLYVLNNLVIIGLLIIVIDGGWKMMIINQNSYGPATGIPLSMLYFAGTLASIIMIFMSITQTVRFVVFNQDPPAFVKNNIAERVDTK